MRVCESPTRYEPSIYLQNPPGPWYDCQSFTGCIIHHAIFVALNPLWRFAATVSLKCEWPVYRRSFDSFGEWIHLYWNDANCNEGFNLHFNWMRVRPIIIGLLSPESGVSPISSLLHLAMKDSSLHPEWHHTDHKHGTAPIWLLAVRTLLAKFARNCRS